MATTIENFRPVGGVARIYRCAKTEPLAAVTTPSCDASRVILKETGLVLDLRSKQERDDSRGAEWMARFGFAAVDAVAGDKIPETLEKLVIRVDVQSRARMFEFITRAWLTPTQKAMVPMLKVFDTQRLHEIRMEALNSRGLAGLNEAILESGSADLCFALKAMTNHLENSNSSIVFHCVQGKDR